MRVSFLPQPLSQDAQVGRILCSALLDDEVVSLRLATAWAKHSGLSRLVRAARALRNRGGHSQAIVGVDEGGATWEGLRLAFEIFDEVYVYHDTAREPHRRTFHPKVYLTETADRALLLVGSSNLTKGGLFSNYEANLRVDLDLAVAEDKQLAQQVRDYFDWLIAQTEACVRLTEEYFETLRNDGTIIIRRESSQNRSRRQRAEGKAKASTAFGSGVRDLAPAPGPDIPPIIDDVEDDDSIIPEVFEISEEEREAEGEQTEAEAGEAEEEEEAGIIGFWKELSANDVSTTSSPGQIIIPIRFRDFFEPLNVQIDETASGGVRQSEAHLVLTFRDDGYQRVVNDARVILYEPASHHPRQNREIRFTFRDREILNRLGVGDILVFRRTTSGITVDREPPGSRPSRFGHLT